MYLRIFVMLLKALHGIQKETTNKQKKPAPICSGVLFCFLQVAFVQFVLWMYFYFSYLVYDVSRNNRKELLIFEVWTWNFNFLTRAGWSFLLGMSGWTAMFAIPFFDFCDGRIFGMTFLHVCCFYNLMTKSGRGKCSLIQLSWPCLLNLPGSCRYLWSLRTWGSCIRTSEENLPFSSAKMNNCVCDGFLLWS